jgi:uncharacterized protein with beta-barrel porin domain
MSPRLCRFCVLFAFSFFLIPTAKAVVLNSGQTNYITSVNITTSGVGISSTLVGTALNPDRIKNTFTITTGNFGATTSAYGIKTSGNYNNITNDIGAAIITTGNSGRGVSVANLSSVINLGSISTQGTTSYGIHLGGDNNLANNSGSINTANTTSYGINSDGNNNVINNSGTIITAQTHGIYVSAGSSSIASSTLFNSVNNSGNINAFANGIYAKDNYTQITNSGTITSGAELDDYGIATEGSNSVITNSGTINSARYAIFNSGDDAIINNSGTLNGEVHTGNGVLNIFGGAINGKVFGSARVGSVNVGDASHVNVIFNQTYDFSEIDVLNISSNSTLNSYAEIDANLITLDENSTLVVTEQTKTSAAIRGLSNSKGTLQIEGILASTIPLGASGYSLKNLNIGYNSVLVVASDIYADNIFVDGGLNLSAANNLNIFGSLSGSGSAIINVGNGNQNVSGNFTLLSGDIFVAALDNNRVGSLTVGGVAMVDANVKLMLTLNNSNYFAEGTKLTLISSAPGSTINEIDEKNITINGINSNVYGLLRFTSVASGSGLFIEINHLSAEEVTSNKNVQNIYKNLNLIGAKSSGSLLQFQQYLDSSGLSGDKITTAINQLAPSSSKAALATTAALTNNSMAIAEARLSKRKDGFWAQPFGSATTQYKVEDDDAYNANSAGFAFGADIETNDEAFVGAALSLARSTIKSEDDYKKNAINSSQINFYERQNYGKYFFDKIFSAAWNQYASNRSIVAVSNNATARYSGQTYALKLKGGATQKLQNGFEITPEMGLNFLHNQISSYSEKGADSLNLKVSAVSADFAEIRPGINFGWSGKVSELTEFPKIAALTKISYGHAFVNDAPQTTASFVGQNSSFTSQISHMDNDSLKFGLALEAYHIEGTAFFFDYTLEKRATYQSNFFALKIRQEF